MLFRRYKAMTRLFYFMVVLLAFPPLAMAQKTSTLLAGVAKVDVTNLEAGPTQDKLFVKALVLKQGETTSAIITVDAVAIGEIGPIKNDYFPKVREALQKELNIAPANVMANASHCHGIVCKDIAERTVEAVRKASSNLVAVKAGTGVGFENRIMENRRLKLKSGRELDVRHAYSLPPDDEVAAVGPIDPQIGILKLERMDGKPLALVYNFACHPIMGLASGENTADLTGFASRVIENNLGEDTVALFIQGCGGDINPVMYKDVNNPRNAEPLGNQLGLSVLAAARKITCTENPAFKIVRETLDLPRADLSSKIDALIMEQGRLVKSLRGTSLNFKTFLPLMVKYNLSPDFPSYYSHRYLQEKAIGKDDMEKMDAANRKNMQQYLQNIHTMEALTRNQTNLALLQKHQATNVASGKRTLEVEILGIRVGDFVLVTFPGELTVEIGLGIKKTSPHKNTFVAGYTNGYIYYTPTAKQLENRGGAQEDSDCLLAPEWQKLFEDKVTQILKKL